MSKKVFIINSSPRKKGNSEILCQQFMRGAIASGNQVELVNINDYKIHFCKACEYCRHHANQCLIKDDANIIIQKMMEADVWVFASPVYFYSLSAQLKTLFDRMFAREYEIRDEERKRESYLILTSGSTVIEDMSGAIDSYLGFIKVLRKVEDKGLINGLGAFMLGDGYNHPANEQAYKKGEAV